MEAKLSFSFTSLRPLYAFGSPLLCAGFLGVITEGAYDAVIGKLCSAAQLGLFRRARSLQQTGPTMLCKTLAVIYPSFARIQDEPERLKNAFRRATRFAAFLGFPLSLGMAVVAQPLVHILLTDKWLPCVRYLQIFCLGGLTYSLSFVILQALLVKGYSRTFLRVELIKRGIMVLALLCGIPWGALGLTSCFSLSCFLSYLLNAHYAGRQISYSLFEQLRDVTPYFVASVLMCVITYLVGIPFSGHPALQLALQFPTATVVYGLTCGLPRLESFMELYRVLLAMLRGFYPNAWTEAT